jgi:regulator of chromosome condensation
VTIELPTLVHNLLSHRIQEIRGGNHHSIAFSTDGVVLIWGRCEDGQMGISLGTLPQDVFVKDERGLPRILLSPTQVPSEFHTLAIAIFC